MNDIARIMITPKLDIKKYCEEDFFGGGVFCEGIQNIYNYMLDDLRKHKSIFSTLISPIGVKPRTRRERIRFWLNERRDRIARALAILRGEDEYEED